jgi:myo-inositol-1(or 4)-monophosphatase
MNAWDCLAGLLMVREAGGRTGSYPKTHEEIAHGGAILAVAPGVAEQFANDTMISLAAEHNDQKETNNQRATELELTA